MIATVTQEVQLVGLILTKGFYYGTNYHALEHPGMDYFVSPHLDYSASYRC